MSAVHQATRKQHGTPARHDAKADAHHSYLALPQTAEPAPFIQAKCACGGECPQCEEKLQLQPTLAESPPDDKYEAEVDRVADHVMRLPDARGQHEAGEAIVPSIVQDAIHSPGQSLDPTTRELMESQFGRDFSRVRVHTDARAAESTRALNAQAYTVGREVVFGAGQYAPGTHTGKSLLAHELTHVVQQHRLDAQTESLTIGNANDAHEQEAIAAADWLMHGHFDTRSSIPVVQSASKPTIMRSQVFASTMEICQRLLESRVFHVSEGGIRVTANAAYEMRGAPECSRADYHMTLSQEGLIFDSEYGTCEFPQGLPFSRQWTNLPNGDYYLTIWTNNTNPYCCLVGDIIVEQQSGLQGESCTQPPPGPLEILHTALDLAGLVPVLGAVPDAVNAGIYVIEGDWTNAGLSVAAILPIFGEAATVGKIGARTVVRVTGEGVERVGREGIEAGLREARASQHVAGQAAEGAERTTQRIDVEIDEAIERAFEEGRVTSGERLELLGHGSAPEARAARGQTGRQVESAHGAPQSAMRGLASYDPNAALTRLLPRGVHRAMDRYWQQRARQLLRQGQTSWTAQEMFEAVSESIRRTPGLSDGEKFSHIQRLSDEIFVEWGLSQTDLVRLPFSK